MSASVWVGRPRTEDGNNLSAVQETQRSGTIMSYPNNDTVVECPRRCLSVMGLHIKFLDQLVHQTASRECSLWRIKLSGELYVALHETRDAHKSSPVRPRHPSLCKVSFEEPTVFSMLLAATKANNSLCEGTRCRYRNVKFYFLVTATWSHSRVKDTDER